LLQITAIKTNKMPLPPALAARLAKRGILKVTRGLSKVFLTGLWIRIRIGSGFNDFVDPDSESGSMGHLARKMKKKMHFSLTF
jgi:hypothetical protein